MPAICWTRSIKSLNSRVFTFARTSAGSEPFTTTHGSLYAPANLKVAETPSVECWTETESDTATEAAVAGGWAGSGLGA